MINSFNKTNEFINYYHIKNYINQNTRNLQFFRYKSFGLLWINKK